MAAPNPAPPESLNQLDISPPHDLPDGVNIFHLGDWKLQSGEILPNAHIAYKTFGDASLPAIIYPTWFSGSIADNEWLIPTSPPSPSGPQTLSPQKYHIIIPALFGNGQSSSPSLFAAGTLFPQITLHDNIRAQHALLTQHLGITRARAVLGWSMGAAQTYQWITQYPDFVEVAVPFCGAARVAVHNNVFLEGVKGALVGARGEVSRGVCEGSALLSGEGVGGGNKKVWSVTEKQVGLRAFARVYAGWGFSQTWYRERKFETALGYKDLEDFMVGFWEKWALSKDPDNLLTMLHTWQAADVSNQPPYNGDFSAAMGAIKAKTFVLPGLTDLYFPPEDSALEVAAMAPGVGVMIPFPSIWGHWAGGPGESREDVRWLDEKLAEFGL